MVHAVPGTLLTCSPETCHLCHLMYATPLWNAFPAPFFLFIPVKSTTSFRLLFSLQDQFSSVGLPFYTIGLLHPPRCSGQKPDSHPIPQSSSVFLQYCPCLSACLSPASCPPQTHLDHSISFLTGLPAISLQSTLHTTASISFPKHELHRISPMLGI